MTAFGGLLALVKFLDLIKVKDVFKDNYVSPPRKTIRGCYRMVLGLLIMLFVGFQRIGHIKHLRQDSMITDILKVSCLPADLLGHRKLFAIAFLICLPVEASRPAASFI